MVELSKEVYRSRALFAFLPPLASYVLANQLTILTMNYFGSTMTCYTFERLKYFMRATYGYVYIVIVALLVVWKVLGITKMAQKM